MIEVLMVSGLINGLINGLSSYAQQKAISSAQKAQAKTIQNIIEQIKKELARNEIDTEEALKRIDTLIDKTKGTIKEIMEKQVNQIAKEQQEAFEKAMREYRATQVQRRLAGSEAYTAGTRKMLTEQSKELGDIREKLATALSGKELELEQQRFARKEAVREASKLFRLQGLQQIWQLQSAASGLSGGMSPTTAGILGGLSGGIPQIIAGAFMPQLTKQQEADLLTTLFSNYLSGRNK